MVMRRWAPGDGLSPYCQARSRLPVSAVAFIAMLLAVVVSWVVAGQGSAVAQTAVAAEAARLPPLTISIHLSSRRDSCFDTGETGAIARMTRLAADAANEKGGIHGRRVALSFQDDVRNDNLAVAGVRAALSDPSLLAMVGLTGSQRGQAVFDALGKTIEERGVPFLSNISVTKMFAKHANVFTTAASQDDDRVPTMTAFVGAMEWTRVAFLGVKGTVFSEGLGDGLKAALPDGRIVADHRIPPDGDGLDVTALDAALRDIQERLPDVLVLGLGSGRADTVIERLSALKFAPALFVTGRIDGLEPKRANGYLNAIYQLAWDRLPEVDNDRIRRKIERDPPATWMFEGKPQLDAPGWAKGECKPRPAITIPDPLESANMRAIAVGARYADMVALVVDAARSAPPGSDPGTLRRQIVDQLSSTYAAGRGAFRGTFENWSFHAQSRAAVKTPFVVMLPQGLGRTQLAPIQFVRTQDGSLRRIPTVYMDVDLVRAHRIDDNDKTFFAEFHLSMRGGEGIDITRLEMTNAYLDPRSNGRHVSIETLHPGGPSTSYPTNMKLYKVTGRFTFEPDLASYPFDKQRFSIDLQPRRSDLAFVVQPPPLALRDRQVATDGWDVKSQYVGYEEDFVPLLDAYTHVPSAIPYYKASFVWTMARQTTDYYLRVVIPLAFILIVAYLSVFISNDHFEAIVTIQVTALLSAVALYLSLPKLDSDTATVSDRIFLLDYMLVSLMIGISILRVNSWIEKRPLLRRILAFTHIVVMPALVVGLGLYVLEADPNTVSLGEILGLAKSGASPRS